MTLIPLRRGVAVPPDPATHVLAIGVSEYPYLSNLSNHPDLAALAQLTSPHISATRIAYWARDKLNAVPPVGSIELITAPSQTGDGVVATLQTVRDAFDNWYARCDTDRANVAVFYYCGHGVMNDDLILLGHDFGKVPYRLEEGAFSFTKTYLAMGGCAAATQWFFVDACRQMAQSLLPFRGPIPGLRNPSAMDARNRPGCILYATSPNAAAYERINVTTRFTEALLAALEGSGAQRTPGGTWGVTRLGLDGAVSRLLELGNHVPGTPFQASQLGEAAGDPVLHHLTEAPELDISVRTRPDNAADQAEFALKLKGQVRYRRPPAAGEWKARVKAAVYQAAATFDAPGFRNAEEDLWAMPPCPDVLPLEVGT
jgi:hypothetical protein